MARRANVAHVLANGWFFYCVRCVYLRIFMAFAMSDRRGEFEDPLERAALKLDKIREDRRNALKADFLDVIWLFAGLCFAAWLLILFTQ